MCQQIAPNTCNIMQHVYKMNQRTIKREFQVKWTFPPFPPFPIRECGIPGIDRTLFLANAKAALNTSKFLAVEPSPIESYQVLSGPIISILFLECLKYVLNQTSCCALQSSRTWALRLSSFSCSSFIRSSLTPTTSGDFGILKGQKSAKGTWRNLKEPRKGRRRKKTPSSVAQEYNLRSCQLYRKQKFLFCSTHVWLFMPRKVTTCAIPTLQYCGNIKCMMHFDNIMLTF